MDVLRSGKIWDKDRTEQEHWSMMDQARKGTAILLWFASYAAPSRVKLNYVCGKHGLLTRDSLVIFYGVVILVRPSLIQ
jgi:hypothetical protein